MRVFLIGATGYIGSVVAEALQAAGHSVTAQARTPESDQELRDLGMTTVRGDISAPPSLEQGVDTCEAVVFLGTTNDPRLDRDAVASMLKRMYSSGKTFIYTSGVWVVGNTNGQVYDETAALNPAAVVAWRPGVEAMVFEACDHDVRGIVIRPAIVYGRAGGLLGSFVQSANEQRVARYPGNGDNHWPLVHVDDLAELYVLALEKAPARSLYTAVDGPAYTVKQLAEAASFGADAGGETKPWNDEEARGKLGPMMEPFLLDQQFTGEKAQRELGWKPRGVSALEDLKLGSYALPRLNP